MTTGTRSRKSSTGASLTVASTVDRARAFRSARRHSILVRALKLTLPAVSVVALAAYAVTIYSVNSLKGSGITLGKVVIDPKNLTMETPRYNGFGKDGSRYVVQAKEAVTDLKQTGPVRLNVIDGEITQTSGVVTKLKATWGTYDQKKDVLELYEKIDVDGSTGMKARLVRATVFPKESRIVSKEPVYVENETGNIRSKQMEFNSKLRKGTFTEAVHVRLKANQPAKADAAKSEAPAKAPPLMPGLAANSGQPIEVRAERLDFDDGVKSALFRTNVIAKQGEAVLQAPELDVFYEGKAALEPGAPKPKADPAVTAPAEPQTKLKTIKARGGVIMTNKEDRATAATLDYEVASEVAVLKGNVVLTAANERGATSNDAMLDQKADTALLTGNVVITQGKNVMKGQRLFVDRKAGTTRLDSPPIEWQPAGRIETTFYQNEAKAAAAAAAKAAKPAEAVAAEAAAAGPFGGFKTDPSQPIEVEADSLDVADQKKVAIFKGNVIAKQGAFVVQTSQLNAHYTGQAGIASGSTPGAKAEPGQSAAQLTRIETRQKVVVTGKDGQRAVGDWADFDVKANIVTIGGNKVIVSEGKNVIEGPAGSRFVINMTTGISNFEQVGERTAAKSSTASPSTTAGIPTRGRMRAVLYPKDSAAAAKSATKDKEKDKPKPKTDTSAWDSTTSSNQRR